MDMHQLEARVRRAKSKARHARAVCAEEKSARAHKRDQRRASALMRLALEEEREADYMADLVALA